MGPFNDCSIDGTLGFFAWFDPNLFVPAKKQPDGTYTFFEVDGKRVEHTSLVPCLDFLRQQQEGSNQ